MGLRPRVRTDREPVYRKGLPVSAAFTELNERIFLPPARRMNEFTLRVVSDATLGFIVPLGFLLLADASLWGVVGSWILPAAMILLSFVACWAFLQQRPTESPLWWLVRAAACWGALYALTSLPGARATYLCIFGPSLAVCAAYAHLVSKQTAFYFTTNPRARYRVQRRWRRYWTRFIGPFPTLRHPLLNPKSWPGVGRSTISREVSRYRMSFGFVGAAFLVGYLVLRRIEESQHAPWALAAGVLTATIGVIVVWLLVLETDECEVGAWQAFRVSWFAITFFHVYDYAETQAAGIFRLPTKFFRPGLRSVRATAVVLGILSLPVVQAVRHAAAAELRQVAELAMTPAVERGGAPSPDLERYLEQLPRAERDALLGRTKSRSPPERFAFYVEAAGASGRLLVLVILGSLGPFVILVTLITCTGGRILLAYYHAFEAPDATEISYDEQV